ncbi:MAG: 3-hydroxyacyl-CoA dehydrogenase [Hydrocarboniphaga sp.]|uniref:3-hydroxyacyl-CoA dehydrogenase NAD-binding domain-containing protein n=1 Tax=Hydrocarboniphaga sp. TaxID=2033016 RepID=UPI00261E3F47|nr:3-hydroxyacyl-CoA dehydrogenase NAD-binding domain-containing protein [Hydrocarboniphaga sp.]MDB5969685.1 3-hydroxyacyl-CoA dehydrogenase [Hydrocarboniphaga sp.]
MSAFKYDKDADGIVTVTMDMPGPVNAMNPLYRDTMAETVARLEKEEGLKGVVITSAKTTFFAGGDLNELLAVKAGDEAQFQALIDAMKGSLRRIEKLPVAVVAAINGAALGGGFEITLACNRRIVVDSPAAVVGLPEVGLGLLPGAGGIVRLVNMLGLEKALLLLLEGTRLQPADALKAGLVDEIVGQVEDLLPTAKAWIKAQIAAGASAYEQPWDRKGHRIPGGTMAMPDVAGKVSAAAAILAKKTRGLLPAPERILAVAAEATMLDFESALRVETRGLTYLAMTPQAKNIISTMFFQMNEVNGGASRPKDIGKSKLSKVGILGAGMMGQGIAYASAIAGIEVVLRDVTLEAAQKGKAYSEKLLAAAVAKGLMTEEKKAAVLALIKPTDDTADLQGAELIVEAVFENVDLKAMVTKQTEQFLAEGGVFGSNTSTLPISLLAKAAKHPENFIGIHFFSPVDKMPLVEIIRGERTGDAALAKAFDYARQIGKTAIVVNDSLGFFTSRTIGTFLDESCRLLLEGLSPVALENLARQIGMPAGPLTVFDEVSLELMRKVNETHKAMGVFGSTYDASASDALGNTMIKEHGRPGRQYGGGFYEYPAQGEKFLWPRLFDLFYKPDVKLQDADVKDRILFRQVIEAIKCLQEGVLHSVADGNVGSILGIGAPIWTGGFIQFVNTYGVQRFVDRSRELEIVYGPRFAPPELAIAKARAGESFR